MDVLDGQWIEVVPAHAPFAAHDHKIRVHEDFEMLHDGAAVERWKAGAEFPCGPGMILQCIQNFAKGGRG